MVENLRDGVRGFFHSQSPKEAQFHKVPEDACGCTLTGGGRWSRMLACGRDRPNREKVPRASREIQSIPDSHLGCEGVGCAHEAHCVQLAGILCCSLMIDFFWEEAEDRAKFRPKGKRR